MLRFIARHGLVRIIGGRAVPALLVWDLAMLANRTRRIPAVDRRLRQGAGLAVRGLGAVASSRPTIARPTAARPTVARPTVARPTERPRRPFWPSTLPARPDVRSARPTAHVDRADPLPPDARRAGPSVPSPVTPMPGGHADTDAPAPDAAPPGARPADAPPRGSGA